MHKELKIINISHIFADFKLNFYVNYWWENELQHFLIILDQCSQFELYLNSNIWTSSVVHYSVYINTRFVTYHFLGLDVDFLTWKKITLWEYDN